MGGAIIYLSSLVIIALNVILGLDAGFEPDWPPGQRIKFGMVVLADLANVGSSFLWALWLYPRHERWLGTLFAANLVIFTLAFAVRSRGLMFPAWAFAAIDLYWLQLYLTALITHFRSLRVGAPTSVARPAVLGLGKEDV